jgi:hypothetical protein
MLRLTTAVFATVYFVHGVDHLRRGLDFESTPIIVIGIVQTLLVVFAVVLVATRSRRAPLAAVGTVNAAGFTLQHVLPAWFGPLSDSFIDAPPHRHVSAFSWLVVLLDIVAALAFATAGGLVGHRCGSQGRLVERAYIPLGWYTTIYKL